MYAENIEEGGRAMALAKNQIVELTVTGVTGEGNGVARYVDAEIPAPGLVIFIPFTAVGDRLLCRIVKVHKNHAFGKIEQLLQPSPDRMEATCAVFGRCGGCVWQHITYEAECRYKAQWVQETLQRVGGVDDVQSLPLVAADTPMRYRNKAQFPVAAGEQGPVMGFFAPRSHRIVPCRDCGLQPAAFSIVLDTVDAWMVRHGVTAYDEEKHRGLVRHVYIRQGAVTGQIMVCLVVTSGRLPAAESLVSALREAVPTLVSLYINVNPKRTNVILGEDGYTLWGEDAIEDRLCGLLFRLSPYSFYQVNHAQTEKLYRLAGEFAALSGKETVLDLYCGTGTIGLSMADKAGRVIGVEVVSAAVEDARRNAAQNGIENARFLCADAAQAAATLAAEGVRPDVVILDPPRKGCDEALVSTVAEMGPRRVVYVSCDPATLARDIQRFVGYGYHPQKVRPVDLFPRTAHVETVALLSRNETN